MGSHGDRPLLELGAVGDGQGRLTTRQESLLVYVLPEAVGGPVVHPAVTPSHGLLPKKSVVDRRCLREAAMGGSTRLTVCAQPLGYFFRANHREAVAHARSVLEAVPEVIIATLLLAKTFHLVVPANDVEARRRVHEKLA